MHILGPLAALLGIEADVLVERVRANAIAYGLVALFAAITLAFLLVAAHLGLSLWVGPLWSALIIAGVALIAALVVYLRAQAIERAYARRMTEHHRSNEAATLVTTAALTALPTLIRNPALRVAAVPVGFIIGYLLLARRGSTKERPRTETQGG